MPRIARLWFAVALSAIAAAQAPNNDSCSNPTVVGVGVNPVPPNGFSGVNYSNLNATNSTTTTFGLACVATNFNKDVWFSFTPAITGNFVVKTCTPSGFVAGALTSSVLAIYDAADCPSGGTALACNDDSSNCGTGSNLSAVGVNLWDGHTYLIRVGTESATAAGTFYLTITAPATAATDTCAGAVPLSLGSTSGSFNGSNAETSGFGCFDFSNPHTDVWFHYTVPPSAASAGVEIAIAASTTVDFMFAYVGGPTCPIGTPFTFLDCGTNTVQWKSDLSNTSVLIRVGRGFAAEPSLSFTLTVASSLLPDNDDCFNASLLVGNSAPFNPSVTIMHSNVGATDTFFGVAAGNSVCVGDTNSDVWFEYVATATGKVLVTTETPAGATPGTLANPVVAVLIGCPPGIIGTSLVACDDDSGIGLAASLMFDAVVGTHYKVLVAGYGHNGNVEGSFWLSTVPQFQLMMSAPGGPGTIQLNIEDGGPNHLIFTCLTVNQGSYPFGPFFGIEPSFTEIFLQLTYNSAPFLAVLNAAGDYQFGPAPSIPGLTIYGVSLEFDVAGNLAGVSKTATFTVP